MSNPGVNGRFDSDTSLEFDGAFSQLLRDNKNKIVLDFHGANFVSSAGLRETVKALKEARTLDGEAAGGDSPAYCRHAADSLDVFNKRGSSGGFPTSGPDRLSISPYSWQGSPGTMG